MPKGKTNLLQEHEDENGTEQIDTLGRFYGITAKHIPIPMIKKLPICMIQRDPFICLKKMMPFVDF
jgi:hypothetical protein